MEAYSKVQKPREETQRNEIKVALSGAINKYLRYSMKILNERDETEKKPLFDHIVIRASGNAIRKAIILVEDIKNKYGNLYQSNKIHTMTVTDLYEPKIEGLLPVRQERFVTAYDCILSKEELDTNDVGY
jgi:DNA-binding protein